MNGKKRNKALRAKHREVIAEMRMQSIQISKIAATLSLSIPTVKRELRKLAAEWRRNAAETVDAHRERELARLEIIEREAFAEWERSKQDYVKQTTERLRMPGKGEDGADFETEPKVIKRETGGRIGDPKFLQIVLNAQETRRKLLGLDAPTKVAPTDPTGEKAYQPEQLTDAELDARLAELIAKLGHVVNPP